LSAPELTGESTSTITMPERTEITG
jgi:hypothetical protein